MIFEVRLPPPSDRYDRENEAAFRRILEQALSRQFTEIKLGSWLIYDEGGVLKAKDRTGTVTVLAP